MTYRVEWSGVESLGWGLWCYGNEREVLGLKAKTLNKKKCELQILRLICGVRQSSFSFNWKKFVSRKFIH